MCVCVVSASVAALLCPLVCSLRVSAFVPPIFAVMGITVFTRRRVMEEKTNKHMSSVSFIGGQPVISASAVVSSETLSSNLSVFI